MRFLITIFLLIYTGLVFAKSEDDYVKEWCTPEVGEYEKRLYDYTADGRKLVGRIDCETTNYAIEFDWASKWAECEGQAMFYSARTGKSAGCMLIVKEPGDCRHVKKLHESIQVNKTPLHIFLIGDGAKSCPK